MRYTYKTTDGKKHTMTHWSESLAKKSAESYHKDKIVWATWKERKPTATELKDSVLEHNPSSHFFDRKTMAFFGDMMKNFSVYHDRERNCYELSRKKAVKHGLMSSHCFDDETFKEIR